jgi:hypothetical protein
LKTYESEELYIMKIKRSVEVANTPREEENV